MIRRKQSWPSAGPIASAGAGPGANVQASQLTVIHGRRPRPVALAGGGVEIGVRRGVAGQSESAEHRGQRRQQQAELQRLVVQQLVQDQQPVRLGPEVAVTSRPIDRADRAERVRRQVGGAVDDAVDRPPPARPPDRPQPRIWSRSVASARTTITSDPARSSACNRRILAVTGSAGCSPSVASHSPAAGTPSGR